MTPKNNFSILLNLKPTETWGILKDTKTCWDVQNFILFTTYQGPRPLHFIITATKLWYLNPDILFGGTGGSKSKPDPDSNFVLWSILIFYHFLAAQM